MDVVLPLKSQFLTENPPFQLSTFSSSGFPGHYFRYAVLFHRADYNLVATTTKTPAPRRMTCLTL